MPPVSTINSLDELAVDLLNVCVSALDLTDAGTPTLDDGVTPNAFVCHAEPAWDCEQLVVYVDGLSEEATEPQTTSAVPGQRVMRAGVILATLRAQVIRCSPKPDEDGNPPSPVDLIAFAHQANQDAWAIWNVTSQAMKTGVLADRCAGVHRDGAIPANDEGGYGGWTFTWRIPLPGIPAAQAST